MAMAQITRGYVFGIFVKSGLDLWASDAQWNEPDLGESPFEKSFGDCCFCTGVIPELEGFHGQKPSKTWLFLFEWRISELRSHRITPWVVAPVRCLKCPMGRRRSCHWTPIQLKPAGNSSFQCLPSGKLLHNYGKSQFLMGKSTISIAIFNSYVSHYQRVKHKKNRFEANMEKITVDPF